jgi:hypothetical protein
MKTLCFFSSPMVNLPCVSWLFVAYVSRALTASLGRTDRPNLALDLVYSWPGLRNQHGLRRRLGSITYKDSSVIRQRAQRHVQRLVHLFACPLEESAAPYLTSERRWLLREIALTSVEQRIPRKHDLVVAVLHEEADAVLGVARRVQRLDGDAAYVEGLAVLGRPRHLLAVLSADDLEGLAEF